MDGESLLRRSHLPFLTLEKLIDLLWINILWSDTTNDKSSFWKNEEKLFDATGSTL
jgi:hypothetical protein